MDFMNQPPVKPEISPDTLEQWQGIVDLAAKIMNVPAALIMKVHPEQIEVFVTSESDGNPYELNELAELNTGLYCETVMKSDDKLLVPNALNDPDWDDNPDIKLGMISYLGWPLHWPSGDIFGTICVLDNKENAYSADYVELLLRLRDSVELQLKQQQTIEQLQSAQKTIEEMSELIPICSYCHQIRDDQGFWEKLETSFYKSRGMKFTHSICPSCMEKEFKDLY